MTSYALLEYAPAALVLTSPFFTSPPLRLFFLSSFLFPSSYLPQCLWGPPEYGEEVGNIEGAFLSPFLCTPPDLGEGPYAVNRELIPLLSHR
jgi:hypothetical protein